MKYIFNVDFLLRLPIGMSFLGHGLIRLPKLSAFAEAMVEQFSASVLPDPLVLAFGYLLPLVELVIGLLVILGVWYRQALAGGIFTVTALLFGSSMIENWGVFPVQLIHGIYFGLLLVWEDQKSTKTDRSGL